MAAHQTQPPTSRIPRAAAPPVRTARLVAALALVVLILLGGIATGHPAGAQADPPPASAPLTWGIRPSSAAGPDGRDRFDYELVPGDTLEDHVGVSNFTTEPLELAVYATDAFTTRQGHFDLLPAAEEPSDVGAWIAFAERTVVVPPRSRLDIPFRLTVPERATPGDHAGGIVASLSSTTTDGSGAPLTVDNRVGARIYLRVGGDLDPAATVNDVSVVHHGSWNPAGTGGATVTYTVTNTGNVRLAGVPTIELAGPFGVGRRTATGPEIAELLPGDELAFAVPLASVAPLGRLAATVTLTPEPIGVEGGIPVPTSAGSATTWAVPWAQLVALVLLLVAVALARRSRRRQKQAQAAALDAARAEGRQEVLVQRKADGTAGDAEVTAESTGARDHSLRP